MGTVFVTGTGTGIGKTFLTAALIRHLRARGRWVGAIKPVVSGFDSKSATMTDPGVLLGALARPLAEIDRMSPWRFAAPLSPDLAAAREGRVLDFGALIEFSQAAMRQGQDHLFIEGIGGIMVPLDDTHTVLDWLTALRVPLLLVAGSYLGTLSHTLTALQVLAQRHLDIAAIVVSESVGDNPPLDDTVATIARFSEGIEVVGLPRIKDDASVHPVIARIAEII